MAIPNLSVSLLMDLRKFKSGIQTAGKEIKSFSAKANSDLGGFTKKSAANVSKWAKSNSANFKQVGQSAALMSAAIVAEFALASKAFIEFEQGLANVMTLIPEAGDSIRDDLGDGVQELSKKFGVSTSVLLTSMFDIQSATGDTANVMNVLTAATNLAVSGNSNLTDSTSGLLTLMESYGDKLGGAADAADLLFTAQLKARATVGELASASGQFLPIASSLGVNVNELFSAFSQLTVGMGDVNRSSTAMTAIMKSFQKPTVAMKEATMEWFGTTAQTTLANVSLFEILEKLNGVEKERIATMFEDVTGLKALAVLTPAVTKMRQDAIDISQREGSVQKALITQQETFANQLKVLRENFNALQVTIGGAVLPALVEYVASMKSGLESAIAFAKSNPEMVATMTKAALAFTVLGTAIGGLILLLPTLEASFAILVSAVGGSVAGLIAAGLVITATVVLFKLFSKEIKAMVGAIAEFVKSIPGGTAAVELFGKAIGKMSEGISAATKLYFEYSKAVKSLEETNKNLAKQFDEISKANADSLTSLAKATEDLTGFEQHRIEQMQETVSETNKSIAVLRQLKEADEITEAQFIKSRQAILDKQLAVKMESDELLKNVEIRKQYAVAIQAENEAQKETVLTASELAAQYWTIRQAVLDAGDAIALLKERFDAGLIDQESFDAQTEKIKTGLTDIGATAEQTAGIIDNYKAELSDTTYVNAIASANTRIKKLNNDMVVSQLKGTAKVIAQDAFALKERLRQIELEKKKLEDLAAFKVKQAKIERDFQIELINLQTNKSAEQLQAEINFQNKKFNVIKEFHTKHLNSAKEALDKEMQANVNATSQKIQNYAGEEVAIDAVNMAVTGLGDAGKTALDKLSQGAAQSVNAFNALANKLKVAEQNLKDLNTVPPPQPAPNVGGTNARKGHDLNKSPSDPNVSYSFGRDIKDVPYRELNAMKHGLSWPHLVNWFKKGNSIDNHPYYANGTSGQLSVLKDAQRKAKSRARGTLYVPEDGLSNLHEGEAVLPKQVATWLRDGLSQGGTGRRGDISSSPSLVDLVKGRLSGLGGEGMGSGSGSGEIRRGNRPLSGGMGIGREHKVREPIGTSPNITIENRIDPSFIGEAIERHDSVRGTVVNVIGRDAVRKGVMSRVIRSVGMKPQGRMLR